MEDQESLEGREVVEAALLSRRSVRAFLPRAVPRELVERLLTLAELGRLRAAKRLSH